jgi:hypothetical protein
MRNSKSPLIAKVVNGVLVVSVGVDTLKFAIQQNELDRSFNDEDKPCKILNSNGFAEDFCNMMLKEYEDGSTELSRFMDSIGNDLMEYGSEHIEYDQPQSSH